MQTIFSKIILILRVIESINLLSILKGEKYKTPYSQYHLVKEVPWVHWYLPPIHCRLANHEQHHHCNAHWKHGFTINEYRPTTCYRMPTRTYTFWKNGAANGGTKSIKESLSKLHLRQKNYSAHDKHCIHSMNDVGQSCDNILMPVQRKVKYVGLHKQKPRTHDIQHMGYINYWTPN